MKKNLYQLVTQDGDNWGLILSSMDDDKMDRLFNEYMTTNRHDPSTDGFVEFIISEGYECERVFVNEIYQH
jgi:hypothetical protein